jgi:iron complex outermembrane receptor protein
MANKIWKASLACSAAMVALATAGAAAAQQRTFNIPAESAIDSIPEFARQAGLQITTPDDQLVGVQTPAIKGQRDARQALKELLAGTGLRVISDNGAVIVLHRGGEAAGPPGEAGAAAAASQVRELVVTGTHLRGLSGQASPLIVIGSQQIATSGYVDAAEIVRNLPQSYGGGYNASAFDAGGSSSAYNPSGSSTANLRGLGSDSTLTLVDGRRLAAADIQSASDISLIPVGAIERVEVLTDGASAIYGSDAIAGVVNFILKKHYDGLQTTALYGDTTQGGGQLEQLGVLAGKDWRSGNVLISYQFENSKPVFSQQRSYVSPTISGTSLTPDVHRNSVFGYANQQITDRVNFSVEGLYTSRENRNVENFSPLLPGYINYDDEKVQQYGVSTGLEVRLGGDWQLSLAGNYARQETQGNQNGLLSGAQFSHVDQNWVNYLGQGEISATGTVLQGPAGPIKMAVGGSVRREAFYVRQGSGSVTYSAINVTRTVRSLYAEFNIPLVGDDPARTGLNALSLDLAGRYDDYTLIGSSIVPKVGLVYKISPELQLKASWGRSFRAAALAALYGPATVLLYPTSNPLASSGISPIIIKTGGNPSLKPETSTTSTFSMSYQPSWLSGANLEVTYFNINYTNRIENVFGISASPLIDPNLAPFLVLNPTPTQQSTAIASGQFYNYTGAPYDPTTVAAIFDGRFNNTASQEASGVDATARYLIKYSSSSLDLQLNASYLDLTQKITSVSPRVPLTGTVFNPPHVRARAGATWTRGPWNASGFLNYVGKSSDPFSNPVTRIASWTTADGQIAYNWRRGSSMKQTTISLSVQNLLDQKPPFATSLQASLQGLNYDSTNASPVGRFVSLKVVADW